MWSTGQSATRSAIGYQVRVSVNQVKTPIGQYFTSALWRMLQNAVPSLVGSRLNRSVLSRLINLSVSVMRANVSLNSFDSNVLMPINVTQQQHKPIAPTVQSKSCDLYYLFLVTWLSPNQMLSGWFWLVNWAIPPGILSWIVGEHAPWGAYQACACIIDSLWEEDSCGICCCISLTWGFCTLLKPQYTCSPITAVCVDLAKKEGRVTDKI